MAEATKEAEKKPIDRVIRVFVSSTFRDMHAEREELVKRVFPELRKLCEARGVTWGEVDLRWGIPDERKAEGKVLPICLAEIQNCRPYFIGILGERYGWVPREMSEDLIQAQSWLKEHVQEGKSVTELEILHGVLNDPQMATHAFFYFRDPAHGRAAGLVEGPDEEEVKELGPVEAAARADGRKLKLAELKDRIRQAHREDKIAHPPRENFAGPTALGELVRKDLREVIDALFPEGSQPDPLTREAAEHEGFARSRARVYVERPALFAALDAHAAGAGPPLVVLGESGGGKSALLANWARRLRERGDALLVIEHYIGATPASTDWAEMLRRILGELDRHFALKLEIPDKPEALRAAFANGLYRAAAQGRVVLVLDGLNQIEDRDQAPDLVWLPPELPPNVRLVLSTLKGRSLKALAERGWPTLTVDLLSVEERRELIPEYLKQYGKELSPARTERLAKAAQTASPLYLRTLLEELRQWGDHNTLDGRIDHCLAAATPRELFAKVLERWEQDFERDRPDLVRDAMVRLWAARRGLSEVELLEMLGHAGEPLPRARWSPLLFAADASLVSRSGLLGFAHDYLRQSVEGRYAAAPEAQRLVHAGLADYFAPRALGPRKVDELPWQLARAQEWQRLADLLAEPEFFVAAWDANQFEVKAYWVQIEVGSAVRMVQAYRGAISGEETGRVFVWNIGILLGDTGHPDEALAIRQRLAEQDRASGNLDSLQASLCGQAVILTACGQLDQAMASLKEAEHICREIGNLDILQTSLNNQANILYPRGQLDQAMALYKEQERICRQLGNLDGLQTSLGNQAVILYARGQLDQAMALCAKQERICRQLGNLDGIQRSLNNQAGILSDRGQLDQAMALHKEAERVCRQLGNLDGIQRSLNNQAVILTARGQLDQAMALHKEAERVYRQLGNLDSLQISLGNQALILKDRGQLDQAMALHEEQERICRQLGNLDSLQRSLGNQALILDARGQLDQAMALHKEQEGICRQLGNLDGLQISLGNQAAILSDRGQLDQAMALHKEEERICQQLGNLSGLATSLVNQAIIHSRRSQFREAIALAEQALETAQSHGLEALTQKIQPMLARIRSQAAGRPRWWTRWLR
jgi:tetratricopeptide (TPR) repeat protein